MLVYFRLCGSTQHLFKRLACPMQPGRVVADDIPRICRKLNAHSPHAFPSKHKKPRDIKDTKKHRFFFAVNHNSKMLLDYYQVARHVDQLTILRWLGTLSPPRNEGRFEDQIFRDFVFEGCRASSHKYIYHVLKATSTS